jgi:predicted HTH domain antitoxin
LLKPGKARLSSGTLRKGAPLDIMAARTIEINNLPDSVNDAEVLAEIALGLYDQERVSLGRAAEIARMGVGEFMKFASGRGVATCRYEPEELEEEIDFIRNHFG